ncbi:hypothetical protein [Larkinella soli]|uniref:hypothetical protein n=1 Tax=Larkinella soli TaxID=1770527 RepID=UPI000FFB9FCF|nr:hypothetical protein [Larkinella soli]
MNRRTTDRASLPGEAQLTRPPGLRRIGLAVLVTILLPVWVTGQTASVIREAGWAAMQNPDGASGERTSVPLYEEPDFQVLLFPSKNPLLLKLLIGNKRGRKWMLKLETERGDLLHVDSGRADWAWQRLNLTDLPEGRYQLVIHSGPHRLRHLFTIAAPSLIQVSAERSILF